MRLQNFREWLEEESRMEFPGSSPGYCHGYKAAMETVLERVRPLERTVLLDNPPRSDRSRFVDQSHAEGMVKCLERHFEDISKLLDTFEIPSAPLGVELPCSRRVWIALAMLAFYRNLREFDNNVEPGLFKGFASCLPPEVTVEEESGLANVSKSYLVPRIGLKVDYPTSIEVSSIQCDLITDVWLKAYRLSYTKELNFIYINCWDQHDRPVRGRVKVTFKGDRKEGE